MNAFYAKNIEQNMDKIRSKMQSSLLVFKKRVAKRLTNKLQSMHMKLTARKTHMGWMSDPIFSQYCCI